MSADRDTIEEVEIKPSVTNQVHVETRHQSSGRRVFAAVSSGLVPADEPELLISLNHLTKSEWELFKRIGDRAWTEYERRFPAGG